MAVVEHGMMVQHVSVQPHLAVVVGLLVGSMVVHLVGPLEHEMLPVGSMVHLTLGPMARSIMVRVAMQYLLVGWLRRLDLHSHYYDDQ